MTELTPDGGPGTGTTAPGPRVGRRAYLETTVGELFGTPAGISPPGRSMALLPNGANPSLAIPRRPRRSAAGAVRLYKSSAGPATRIGLGLLAAGLRWGAVDLLPRLEVTAPPVAAPGDDDIADLLSSRLGQPVAVAVYSSAPRANRKPVLHVLDRRGRPLAYAKIGNTPLSRRLVEHEARTLGALADRALEHLVVPRLILLEAWRDMDVLLIEPVRFSSRRPAATSLVEAMRELAEVGGRSSHPLHSSPYVASLRARAADLPAGPAATALHEQLELTVTAAADLPLSLGSWHGDWTPWNCARAGSRVAVWDWERFEQGVPVGFDVLHHGLQDRVVRRGERPLDAARSLLRVAEVPLRSMGVPADAAAVVARLYLVDLGVRYLQDAQDRVGGPLGDVAAWLVPALQGSTGGRPHEPLP